MEKTLVLIKPDGVSRGKVGDIISRFETVGLKISAMKMVHPKKEDVDKHYALTEEWMLAVYTKAKEKYAAEGRDFPYLDHKAYGGEIKRGLIDFLRSAPVIAMVLEGEMAISLVRKLVGATEPASSAPGTIRGDLSHDTYALSNVQKRPLRNLIHASGNVAEAENEIKIWFTNTELYDYEHVNDKAQYDASWFLPRE